MKLAAHELQDLNELTMSCVNSVTSMAYRSRTKTVIRAPFSASCKRL